TASAACARTREARRRTRSTPASASARPPVPGRIYPPAGSSAAPLVHAPFDDVLRDERDDGEEHQQGRDGEGTDEVVFVVKDLDVQGHRRRQSADVPGYD